MNIQGLIEFTDNTKIFSTAISVHITTATSVTYKRTAYYNIQYNIFISDNKVHSYTTMREKQTDRNKEKKEKRKKNTKQECENLTTWRMTT